MINARVKTRIKATNMAIFVPLTEERVRRAAPFVGFPKGGNPLWKKFVGIPKGMTIPFEKTPQDEPFHFGIYRLKILFNIIFDITFVIFIST